MDSKIVGYDLATPSADGQDNVTQYLLRLINQFPLLEDDDEVAFQNIDGTVALSLVPISNVAIISEKQDVIGHVKQVCQYSFQIFKTAKGLSERNKIRYKEWLDTLGMWLQGQPLEIDGIIYTLFAYPDMIEGKTMKSIKPANPSVLFATSDGKNEAWVITIDALYTNEFDR